MPVITILYPLICYTDAMPEHNPLFDVATTADGPAGALPLTEDMLLHRPSGDLFGLTQNVGMGWEPSAVTQDEYLILSTLGGLRDHDGKP